ncbi:kinase-like domain [Fusarium agapanthi]|uniref:Kinase-like domain n=1 Tax=Fusarium agapanthi TaxID=1803897 RepID=A0A9P5BAT6_9HYPO|nr:kinase-like domain [Fusarium agapanthi]
MDPTPTNISTFMFPTAIFTRNPPPELEPAPLEWSMSSLNIKNRVDSLDPPARCDWIIQGADLAGTRWFAIPKFVIGRPSLRIDIHPNSPMFCELETAGTSHMAIHILRALHWWSSKNERFLHDYLQLPFGSRILFETLSHDIRQMNIQFVPVYDIERQWLSEKTIHGMWDVPDTTWPGTVDFRSLQFQRRLHDTIDVVSIDGHGNQEFVFKSLMNDIKYLYHELKTLMAIKPHPNIILSPIYPVTKRCGFGGRRGVCGMILKYYRRGTLRRWLKEHRQIPSEISHTTKGSWAKQIVSALIHIKNHGPGYYTNLKLDNVVVAESHDYSVLKVVIIDFEQRLGSPAWTPPEIHSVTFLADLIHHDPHSSISRSYHDLFCRYGAIIPESEKAARYTNSETGYCYPWSSLSPKEREDAQVFMLGKILWCLFENASLLNSYIGINSFRDNYSGKVFPDFDTTPRPLRQCILQCTSGSWESTGRTPPLVAHGKKIVLRDCHKQGRQSSVEEVQVAIRKWWRQQILDAEAFLKCHGSGTNASQCGRRPSLQDVLRVLDRMELQSL